ncbi:MAG TPA: TetR family transcriptional regulator [Gammaproteobacteria bacterium]|nr:TetR family transcriptional regulator [Gammaproteobacteria bacterium]
MNGKPDTRTRMIEAALDLFHRQGVNATSIDEVLALSHTGKSQFSHYFKTKDGLIQASLEYLSKVIRSGESPSSYEIKTWEDMERWFQQYIDYQKSVDFERSCPLGTIGNDLSNEQPMLRMEVRLFLEWARGKLARFFAERQAAGELQPSAQPEALADFCISIMQGGMLLTKMKRDSDMFEHAAAQANAYIKSLRVQPRA